MKVNQLIETLKQYPLNTQISVVGYYVFRGDLIAYPAINPIEVKKGKLVPDMYARGTKVKSINKDGLALEPVCHIALDHNKKTKVTVKTLIKTLSTINPKAEVVTQVFSHATRSQAFYKTELLSVDKDEPSPLAIYNNSDSIIEKGTPVAASVLMLMPKSYKA